MKKVLIVILVLAVVVAMITGCKPVTGTSEQSEASETAPLDTASETASPDTASETPSSETSVDVEICKDLGLLFGANNGVVAEDTATKPSRIKAAILLLRLKGLESDAAAFTGTDNFSDVTDDWMKPYTAYLKANPSLGFVGRDGDFYPDEEITVEEYYGAMLTALGFTQKADEAGEGDYEIKNVITFAKGKGLSKVSAEIDFTMENLATATVEALKTVVKGKNYTLMDSLVESGVLDEAKAEKALLDSNVLTLAQAQEDFKQFQNIMETYHPMIYTNQEEITELIEAQYKLLHDNMDVLELYRVLSLISAKINCGHTSVKFSKELENYVYQNGNYLPLSIKVIDNRAYVYQNASSSDIPEGAEILSINDEKIEDIIQILLDNTNADGYSLAKKYWMINTAVSLNGNAWNGSRNGFSDLYFKYVERPENFTIEYKTVTSEDNTSSTTISAVNRIQYDIAIKNLDAAKTVNNALFSHTFEKNYAVLSIKSFNYYDNASRNQFLEYLDGFFSELADRKIENLILDLRENRGGSPYSSCDLLTYFINEPTQYFLEGTGSYKDISYSAFIKDLYLPVPPAENNYQGKLYTLINGGTFSSSGHLCALMEYHNIGTFIGEESGGSFVCTDGTQDFILSNSKLIFTCATVPWEVAVEELTPGRGIIPEYEVVPTIQDYINENDVVLAFAIDLIKNGE